MTKHPPRKLQVSKTQIDSLTQVWGPTEHVKECIEQCAEELCSVNSQLKQEVRAQVDQPGLDTAIKSSKIIEAKVQNVADQLAEVNEALESEVQSRHNVEAVLRRIAPNVPPDHG